MEDARKIGVRFESEAWARFKALCRREGVRPGRVLNDFIRLCLSHDTVRLLDRLTPPEMGEAELHRIGLLSDMMRLKNALEDLREDPHGIFIDDVEGTCRSIRERLHRIDDESLVGKALLYLKEAERVLVELLAEGRIKMGHKGSI
ncbi:MAG: hypothetical protein ACP5K1_05805 [Candidatus Bathyarchaeia archaeon]